MSSRMRCGVVAMALLVGCSPASAPGIAAIGGGEAVANPAATADLRARATAAHDEGQDEAAFAALLVRAGGLAPDHAADSCR